MTLPSSGPISMSQINTEFGRGNDLNSYRGTAWAIPGGGSGIFPTGAISFSDFYGKTSFIGSWSGNSIIEVVTWDGMAYYGFETSGSSFRTRAGYGAAGAWVTVKSDGTWDSVSSIAVANTNYWYMIIFNGNSLRSCIRLPSGYYYSSNYVYFTPGTGFTGSSIATQYYNGYTYTWGIETSGGYLRSVYSSYRGSWVSLT